MVRRDGERVRCFTRRWATTGLTASRRFAEYDEVPASVREFLETAGPGALSY